jgi:peptide/nickel transport system substrate-binding protein
MVIMSPVMLDAMPTNFGESFSSCGPFKVVSVAPNERVVLEAFDGFYKGRPEIDRVVLQVLPDPVAQLTALSSGDLHVTNLIPHSNLDRLSSMPGVEVATTAAFISVYLA